jgi:L-fuculose-phosphate aldolase
MSVAVEKAKEQVVKMGRNMSEAGLVTGTWGNLSIRVPKDKNIVITPSGMPYGALQVRDIVVLDMEGRVIDGERKPSTEYLLHVAIYNAREDVLTIMHTHSVFASALAVARKPIPPILEDMAQLVGGGVAVSEYARAGTRELAHQAVLGLGRCNAVLLANHGLVGVGRSLDEVMQVCQIVEKSAQVYVWADLIGSPAVLPDEEVGILRANYLEHYGQPGKGCVMSRLNREPQAGDR